MGAYLFVHFIGKENNENCEQVYFSVSKDGKKWELLNSKKPVLKSNIGECGVRDPFLVRSYDGKKYYIIATDLSIYHRRNQTDCWKKCTEEGSRDIIVWESTDMVSWSEPKAVKIAPDNAGCAWAPEATYDKDTGKYLVYFASKTADDNYEYNRMYSAYTDDFKSFTPAKKYIDHATDDDIKNGTGASDIDTTIIEHNGVYYRFTKNETKSSVVMDRSEHLGHGWERVSTYNLDEMVGYEGPTIFKFHNEDKWCLMLDHFAEKKGYEPFITDDITKGVFTKNGECEFGEIYRHGSVIPITDAEYKKLVDTYGK